MDRRRLLRSSVTAAGAALFPQIGLAQGASQASRPAARVHLRLDRVMAGYMIRPDFSGLSYEKSGLADPGFFSARNSQLIGFFRRLGRDCVLRIGGNSSEFCFWSAHGAPDVKGHAITPQMLTDLGEFLRLTGWSLIYGLNLGYGTPENAADEAAFVMQSVGAARIKAFQIGNEPDLFHKNGIRAADYVFNDYAEQWQRFYDAIRRRGVRAPMAGPDTAYNVKWITAFAARFRNELAFVSSHFYPEGPPSSPAATIENLLGPSARLAAETAVIAEIKANTGLPFRLTETNSCYDGGKRGVSDRFAASLWAVDLMYQQAMAGGHGINFHGGGRSAYSPITGSLTEGFAARPDYYGLLFFAVAGSGQLVRVTQAGDDPMPLLSNYALRGEDGRLRLVLINKSVDQNAEISLDGMNVTGGRVLRLMAPDPAAQTGITFAGAPVGPAGDWAPLTKETLRGGKKQVHLPRASAALIVFEGHDR